MEDQVKLHGKWTSPFSCRVIWALKIKGIPYEYIEEDLSNKTELLLKYNPVYKKIPVLVHGGKPICESLVILEYIEESWPQNSLLPSDPCGRAEARFWAKFADDKGPAVWKMFTTIGEEHEKAKKDCLEMLRTIEEHAFGGKKLFGGENIGMGDIAFGGIAHWMGIMEDIVGEKLVQKEEFPRLDAWVKNLLEVPAVRENLPDRHKLYECLKSIREQLLASP